MFLHIVMMATFMVLVIEGILYALFADQMKQMMAQILNMPVETLRTMGLSVALFGCVCLWLYYHFAMQGGMSSPAF